MVPRQIEVAKVILGAIYKRCPTRIKIFGRR
jgi:hypothetical protein